MDVHAHVHLHIWVAPGALCDSFFLVTSHIFRWYFSVCSIPHNPIYITCSHNDTSKINEVNPERYKGLQTRLSYLQGLSLSDVNMTWTDRGVYFSPTQHIKVVNRFIFLKGCGMGPWLVLVSPCFRKNVVATCKIGSFLCSLDNLLQKNVTVFFFGNQISKWRSFEKRAIFDLLFTFFSHQG